MEQKSPYKETTNADEIDIGQIFGYIKKGFFNLFKLFLRFFVYIRKNIVKFAILLISGLIVGYGLNLIVNKRLKTEVIVKPILDSKNYLYNIVNTINSKVKSRDTVFFQQIGFDVDNLRGFSIDIAPVETKNETLAEEDVKYLELLEKFKNDDLIKNVLHDEVLNKTTLDHRITFYYLNEGSGASNARKVMEYINSNEYFVELVEISMENARDRIEKNNNLLIQIDDVIRRYSNKIAQSSSQSEGAILFEGEEPFDLTGLLRLKTTIIAETENKKLELLGKKEPIRIISFGETQVVESEFFSNSLTVIPTSLIIVFLLIDLIKYLNRRAKELNIE